MVHWVRLWINLLKDMPFRNVPCITSANKGPIFCSSSKRTLFQSSFMEHAVTLSIGRRVEGQPQASSYISPVTVAKVCGRTSQVSRRLYLHSHTHLFYVCVWVKNLRWTGKYEPRTWHDWHRLLLSLSLLPVMIGPRCGLISRIRYRWPFLGLVMRVCYVGI